MHFSDTVSLPLRRGGTAGTGPCCERAPHAGWAARFWSDPPIGVYLYRRRTGWHLQCMPGTRAERDGPQSPCAVGATEPHLHARRLQSPLRRIEVFQVKALLRNHHQTTCDHCSTTLGLDVVSSPNHEVKPSRTSPGASSPSSSEAGCALEQPLSSCSRCVAVPWLQTTAKAHLERGGEAGKQIWALRECGLGAVAKMV